MPCFVNVNEVDLTVSFLTVAGTFSTFHENGTFALLSRLGFKLSPQAHNFKKNLYMPFTLILLNYAQFLFIY